MLELHTTVQISNEFLGKGEDGKGSEKREGERKERTEERGKGEIGMKG